MTKNLIKTTLVAIFIGITAISFSQKMEKYTSVEGKFTAVLPIDEGKIEEVEELVDDYKIVKLQTINNGTVFFISYTIHEIELVDSEELELVSVDSFMEGIGGEIIESKNWIVSKQSGIKTSFKSIENGIVGEYSVIIIGQIQYQLAVVGAAENWDQKVADNVFKSFKIKK